jgi:hypothetical protein
MIRNARKEANLINPPTGNYLEVDIFLPSLKLGFEYQVSLMDSILNLITKIFFFFFVVDELRKLIIMSVPITRITLCKQFIPEIP